ncbi:MAG: HAMP domain-containing protein, partial [Bacteroidetes bacterium]
MSLHFKTRIALFNTAAGAIVTFLVFLVVYTVVYITVYRYLDSGIRVEQKEIINNIHWKGDSLVLELIGEWEEKEHQQAEVSPSFFQVVDCQGRLAFRSTNLLNDHLLFAEPLTQELFSNITLNGKQIRQGMFPIYNENGKFLGQLDIGISQVESTHILTNLRLILIVAFPLMLLVFYFASSWAASAGISPVDQLIRTTEKINDTNISTRITLPSRKDEIHKLTTTINEFLRRIELSLDREKQITADISHELRTPLT